jgi:hypothetical protein
MQPAVAITDKLLAKGIILFGEDKPVVLLAVDWCEISNRSYWQWQKSLAEAVGTTPERVAVHCIHAHCTPWPDEYAQLLVSDQKGMRAVCDLEWCAGAVQAVASAAKAALERCETASHLTVGQAIVEKVASNRRILGEDGHIKAVRWTTTRDAAVRAEPEGLIDPALKTIAFWNRDKKLAVLHYYAVHPSSYENCRVTPDFVGLARERAGAADGVPHIYFTGCSGNITAGKYNDGNHANREIFTQRVLKAMVASEQEPRRLPVTDFRWKTTNLCLSPRQDDGGLWPTQYVNDGPQIELPAADALGSFLCDQRRDTVTRCRAALQLAFRERADVPITVGALNLGRDVSILHLPAEAFIEYQLFAQEQKRDAFVATAAYGDCGPGYICMSTSQEEGGYEPSDSFVAPSSEEPLKKAIVAVLKD